MRRPDAWLKLARQVKLKRLGERSDAGLWITSLPWPRTAVEQALSLGGRATWAQPLGQWPSADAGTPRRLLMVADAGDDAPQTLTLGWAHELVAASPPTAESECFEASPDPTFVWHRHLLRIRHGDRSIGLAMGMRVGGEVHWWEACRLVVLDETPTCRVVEMGGAIPHTFNDRSTLQAYPNLKHPFLHKHNWLNGHIYARLHNNGVCEIFAHHINSRFVNDGGDLEDAVPVIGLAVGADDAELDALCGVWDGSHDRLDVGGVKLDVSEVARLATPDRPGRIDREGMLLAWQPYEGFELQGGKCPQERFGDPYIVRSSERKILRGMARTLRFSLSLSDRSPRVVRYLAPAWWYGLCEEFGPEPLLPVSNAYDRRLDVAKAFVRRNTIDRGFEDGAARRLEADPPEPSWEGELPWGQLLMAYRSGDADDYESALRSAYHFTDVAIDHAAKMVRMHGYPPVALSVPMGRTLASIGAYLETGDRYALRAAEGVVEATYQAYMNSWPRMAVGRDAAFLRSAVMLYRYFGTDRWRQISREVAYTVAQVQRPNGSFGDQGGGTGIHAWGGYITKPWMNMLAIGGILDYLELHDDEPQLVEAVRKVADWLMNERVEHDGFRGWCYQHDYNGSRQHMNPVTGKMDPLPGGLGGHPWHQDNIGRLMLFVMRRFNRPDYLAAYVESLVARLEHCRDDHTTSAAMQFLIRVQDAMWGARWSEADGGRAVFNPIDLGAFTERSARIATPAGEVGVCWTETGEIETSPAEPPAELRHPQVQPV